MNLLREYIKELLAEKRYDLELEGDSLTGLTFEEMSQSVGNSMRRAKLTLTNSPLEPRTYKQGTTLKPAGLWYAQGNSWMEWMRTEMAGMVDNAKYVYAIGFDQNNVISVKSAREAEKITYRFKNHEDSYNARVDIIDWNKMAKTGKAGVEFIPYKKDYTFQNYIT